MSYFPRILSQEGVTVTWKRKGGVNEVFYDFEGIMKGKGPHTAYASGSLHELPPGDTLWAEISDQHYPKIWYSDDDRYWVTGNIPAGEILQIRFRFKIDAAIKDITQIVLRFEGYSNVPPCGVTIKVWNYSTNGYTDAVVGEEVCDEDRTLTITLTGNFEDYIDGDGYIHLFARNTRGLPGDNYYSVFVDYVSCSVSLTYPYADPETGDLAIIWTTEDIKAIVEPAGVRELIVEAGYSLEDYVRIFVIADIQQKDRIVWLSDDWEVLGVEAFYFRGNLEYRTALCRRLIA